MIILKDGQHIFIGDIIDLRLEDSQEILCSGKVVNFVEVMMAVATYKRLIFDFSCREMD